MDANIENDVKAAKDYLQKEDFIANRFGAYVYADKNTNHMASLPDLLVNYLYHLEEKGIIKFTANRH